jgi:hypothetical protein
MQNIRFLFQDFLTFCNFCPIPLGRSPFAVGALIRFSLRSGSFGAKIWAYMGLQSLRNDRTLDFLSFPQTRFVGIRTLSLVRAQHDAQSIRTGCKSAQTPLFLKYCSGIEFALRESFLGRVLG